MSDTLTELQERFCRELAADAERNAARAYVRAGGAAKSAHVSASRWLKLPKVAARLAELESASAVRVEAKLQDENHLASTETLMDYVKRRLYENAERAMQVEPVRDKATGQPTGVFTYEGTVANKALELLGKHVGMFKEVVETRDRTAEDFLLELARDRQALEDGEEDGA